MLGAQKLSSESHPGRTEDGTTTKNGPLSFFASMRQHNKEITCQNKTYVKKKTDTLYHSRVFFSHVQYWILLSFQSLEQLACLVLPRLYVHISIQQFLSLFELFILFFILFHNNLLVTLFSSSVCLFYAVQENRQKVRSEKPSKLFYYATR